MQYYVRKRKIGHSELINQLALASGELYSRTLTSFWRTVKKKGIWLRAKSLMRWHNNKTLHAHSADASVQVFFSSLKSWRELRKSYPKAKPPRRRKKFFKVTWKSSAIKIKDNYLVLSNGRGNDKLVIPWEHALPKQVEIGWDGEQYELRACYKESLPDTEEGKLSGVDLGEVHMAVACDSEGSVILNGRYLRSKRRYQNKLKARLSRRIDKKKKGSKRRKNLIKSKKKQLKKIQNQIQDITHKQTTKLIYTLHERGVKKVVIGDLRGIRGRTQCGKKTNQKLHQWNRGQVEHMLRTDAIQTYGMYCCLTITISICLNGICSMPCRQCGQLREYSMLQICR